MASQRIPSVLAVEVPASGKASAAEGDPSVDLPDGPTWGQEHIANELKLKLGIRVSPRTVGKRRDISYDDLIFPKIPRRSEGVPAP